MKIQTLKLSLLVCLVSSFVLIDGPYQIGDTVKDFQVKSISGQMVSLKNYDDQKALIVTFMCNTCPIVQLYDQRIKDLYQMYAPKGVALLGINANSPKRQPGDSFEKMKEKAEKQGYTFDYAIDETQAVAKAFGATHTPQAFLLKRIDTDWQLVYMGAIDNAPQDPANISKQYLKDAIEAILIDKEVKTTKTKAVGCSIKWL